jgi:predicted  nucleic acid-binding Zn-ribbon protein
VNPQWHDEFVALCALFPSGELTEEQWALLQVHLAYCDSCRVVFDEYQQITSEVIPVMAASAVSESDSKLESFSLEAAEQRLMSRLDHVPAEKVSAPSRRTPWLALTGALAACLALGAFAGVHWYRSRPELQTQPTAVAQSETQKPLIPSSNDQTNLRPDFEHTQVKVAELERQVNEGKENLQQANASLARMHQQLEADATARNKSSDERNQLNQQLVAAQAEAQLLRDKNAATNTTAAQQGARTTSLEARLRDVNSELEEKDRMLALDKEFLAHDREIRDLIGARDLYIADIYDVAQTGKTNKAFGRIFYTKDKSLVFYGYDLDKQSGLKQSVAFQAWGSGDDKQDVSLGLFYQDDTHKRWVLRFNDTKTLAHLNKVFVTAEPQGGSAKPTGKPLLLAYLQMQPNHP